MTLVGLLTTEQKDLLIGQLYDDDSFFNPILDFYDQYIISVEEINFCTNPEFFWVKNLPLIEYLPKQQNFS